MNAPVNLVSTSTTHLLHRAGQLAEDLFARSIGDIGLTARQFVVLSVVETLDDPSQTALCEISGIDRSTLADIVRRLVARGLLSRRRTRQDARMVCRADHARRRGDVAAGPPGSPTRSTKRSSNR